MGKLKGIKEAFNKSVTRGNGFTQQFVDDVNWLIEQAEKVDVYEEYFKENSVEEIEGKMQPYYEEMAKLMEDD